MHDEHVLAHHDGHDGGDGDGATEMKSWDGGCAMI